MRTSKGWSDLGLISWYVKPDLLILMFQTLKLDADFCHTADFISLCF